MANIYSLQLLRNGAAYADKATAKDALERATALGSVSNKDGVAVLARYVADGDVKTLVGFYADASAMTNNRGGASYMTIIDVEGAAESVDELREEINKILGDGVSSGNTVSDQLEALSGNTGSTSTETSVEGAKRYADEKIAEALDALDYNLAKDDNKVVVSLNQTDGKISGESVNITSVKLDGLAAGTDADIAATDTIGEALGKLQAQINAMDKTASAVDGQVVTTVTEEDGKVTETKANVKDLQLGGYTKDAAATGDIASTDTINAALSKLENKAAAITIANDDKSINVTTSATGTNINVNIKSNEKVLAKDGNAGLYTDIKLSALTPSSTTIKEEYALVGTDGTSVLGEHIKIYKDSSISKIYLGYSTDTVDKDSGVITSGTTGEAQSLNYVYHKEDGKYEMVHVDVSKFLVESEFASGVTADATGVVHGVVDPTSEKDSNNASFLTVGADGFKVNGIKDEIVAKINALDATGGTQTIEPDKHVAVEVVEADGKITTVTVVEDNIADADDLSTLSAKTVTEIASSNSSIIATKSQATDGTSKYDIITDASKIQMSGFTSTDVLSGISESDSIATAFKKTDAVITENESVVSKALNDLNDKIEELSGASASGLTEEIETRKRIEGQSGSAYTANANSRYISGATNMNAADVALNDALVTVADNYVSGITVNGNGLTVANNIAAITVNSANSATTASNGEAITVSTDEHGNITLGLSVLDCGTYN